MRLKYKIKDWWLDLQFAWQRVFRGWDDTAHWGLGGYITPIILDTLKYFKEQGSLFGFPINPSTHRWHTAESWNRVLDDMIKAFTLLNREEFDMRLRDRGKDKIIKKGLKLFSQYYESLWT